MKYCLLFLPAALLVLTGLLQAQTYRQPIYSDDELARGGYSGAPQQGADSQQEAAYRMQCLKNTTQVLQQSFAEHCRVRKYPAASPEMAVSAALTELLTDVTHLSNDLASKCGKGGRVSLTHLYRTFHVMEYSAGEAQAISAQAGYSRSLAAYFNDINQHILVLAGIGYRNPRIKPAVNSGYYSNRTASVQEQQLYLPPVPGPTVAYPATVPAAPVRKKEDDHDKLDIGDVLGRLLKKKLGGN